VREKKELSNQRQHTLSSFFWAIVGRLLALFSYTQIGILYWMNEWGKKKERAKGGFSSETLSFVSSKRNPQMSLCNKKKKCYDEVPATVYKE
jgi:hypothetical protein